MKKRRFPVAKVFLLAVLLIILPLAGGYLTGKKFPGEPTEVKKLRGQQVAQTDEGHQEYYFHLHDEKGQRGYREMLEGIEIWMRNFICLCQERMRSTRYIMQY